MIVGGVSAVDFFYMLFRDPAKLIRYLVLFICCIVDVAAYDTKLLAKSLVGRSLASLKLMPSTAEITRMRDAANVDCSVKMPYLKQGGACLPLRAPCLFNVKDDPCERYNLAEIYPNILSSLQSELILINATAVPPSNKPLDPRANPRFWDYTWTNFGDFEEGRTPSGICV